MNRNPLARMSFMFAPPLIMAGWALMRLLGTDGREPGWTISHVVWLAGYVLLGVACVVLYRLTVAQTEPEPPSRQRRDALVVPAESPSQRRDATRAPAGPDSPSRQRESTGDPAGRTQTAAESRVESRRSGRWLAVSLLTIALLGDLCMNVQMSIDLIAGFATGTVEAKNAFTDGIQAVPGVELMVYQLGPALLFTALLAQTVHARVLGRVTTAIPVLVGAAVAVMIVDRTVDTPFRLTMGVASALLWIAFAIVAESPPLGATRAIRASGR